MYLILDLELHVNALIINTIKKNFKFLAYIKKPLNNDMSWHT